MTPVTATEPTTPMRIRFPRMLVRSRSRTVKSPESSYPCMIGMMALQCTHPEAPPSFTSQALQGWEDARAKEHVTTGVCNRGRPRPVGI